MSIRIRLLERRHFSLLNNFKKPVRGYLNDSKELNDGTLAYLGPLFFLSSEITKKRNLISLLQSTF